MKKVISFWDLALSVTQELFIVIKPLDLILIWA